MKKWEGEIYQNRHISLMKWHIGLSIFYFIIFGSLLISEISDTPFSVSKLLMFIPTIVHAILAYGCFQKVELSRRISEWVGFFMVLSFPIGTFVSLLYFLPNTTWNAPESKKTQVKILNKN